MNIVLFGESGVGKTALARGLVKTFPHKFYLPKIVTTRKQREDDVSEEWKFVDINTYIELARWCLLIDMRGPDGKVCYGYSFDSFVQGRINIFFGSPYAVDQFDKIPESSKVLLVGNSELVLKLRSEDVALVRRRMEINRQLKQEFYSQESFVSKCDHIVVNAFTGIDRLIDTFLFHLAL